MDHLGHRATQRTQHHRVPVRINRCDWERQQGARQHARVRHGRQLRGLVGANLDVNLHVSDDLAHFDHLSLHVAPLFDFDRHVVLSDNLGGFPSKCPGDGVDLEDVVCFADFVRIDVRRDEIPIEASASDKAVRQGISVWIEGRRVVHPILVQARVFPGGVEQLGA